MHKKIFKITSIFIFFIIIFSSLGLANTNVSSKHNESEIVTHLDTNKNPLVYNQFNNNSTFIASTFDLQQRGPIENMLLISKNIFKSENIFGLAAFLTSLISLFTLYELKIQRRLSNTPHLQILSLNNNLSIKYREIEGCNQALPLEWDYAYLKKGECDFFPNYCIPLKIINSGLNPALNVKISWSYEEKELSDIFYQFNNLDNGIKCSNSEMLGPNSLHLKRDKSSMCYRTDCLNENVDYILPFSKIDGETIVYVPNIISTYIILNLSSKKFCPSENESKLYDIYTHLEYYDNIGHQYNEFYKLQLDLAAVSFDPKANSCPMTINYSVNISKSNEETQVQRLINKLIT